jgi:hypothetical protein
MCRKGSQDAWRSDDRRSTALAMERTSLIHVIRVGMQEAMMRRGKHFLFLILEYFLVHCILVRIPFSNSAPVHIE